MRYATRQTLKGGSELRVQILWETVKPKMTDTNGTDFNKILHRDTSIFKEELFTAITDMHAGGSAGKG